ncbi:MAG: asparagine--tRNA ligase [Candidatus Bathyarchaeota archaeon]|nr:asparagine--tRNA ligase [Candidatus Bathyarchaeota archaeon]MDH5787082.1 asparagine--tRNA ligase [Candidatus Bathyarchaeota archaeon]
MSIRDVLDGKLTEKEVEIKGWLVNKRSSGGVQFLIIRDGTGTIQVTVHKDEVAQKAFQDTDRLTQESSIIVKGIAKEDKRAPDGYEVRVKGLRLVHLAEQEYPIGKKEHGVDFLLGYRQLWVRSPRQVAILKVRAEVIKACRDFLDENGFTLTDSPILTPAAVEGVATLFEVPYFGDKAFLAQSGQLYVEATIAAFGKVYCFGPTFRAEKSKTPRHLTEFWMVEPEMAFFTFEDNLKFQEDMVTYIVKKTLEKRSKELAVLKRNVKPLKKAEPPFDRISYTEAIQMLQKGRYKIEWGEDLGTPHERFISLKFEKPVFVHRYPAKAKAFYMQPDPENPEVALCADLMAPEGYGEIIGGSERIHDLKLLEQRIEEFGLPKKAYEWYLDLRRYGSVPHSGFGLGIERILMWICKLKHIRETIPFSRTMKRIYP